MNFKKLMSTLLVVAMLASMAITAFADGEPVSFGGNAQVKTIQESYDQEQDTATVELAVGTVSDITVNNVGLEATAHGNTITVEYDSTKVRKYDASELNEKLGYSLDEDTAMVFVKITAPEGVTPDENAILKIVGKKDEPNEYKGWKNFKDGEEFFYFAKPFTGSVTQELKVQWTKASEEETITIEIKEKEEETADPEKLSGTTSLRPAGPAVGVEGTFDYAAAYAEAGVTLENNTITVKEETFNKFMADEANSDKKAAMTNGSNLYVGLVLEAPEDNKTYTKVAIYGETYTIGEDETHNGTDMFGNALIDYFKITNGETLTENTWNNVVATWETEKGEKTVVQYNVAVEIEKAQEPEQPSEPDQGGSSNSGSSSRDDEEEDSTPANAPSANVSSNGAVSAVKVSSDAKKAVSSAKNGKANVNVTNAKTVDETALQNMAKAAAKENVALTMTAKTTDKNGAVVASLKFDAAKAAAAMNAAENPQPVKLGVEMNTRNTKNVVSLFKKWFSNKNMAAVKLAQKGEFGFNVEAAVKVDLKNFNKDTLKFYSYNAATNTYRTIENANYTIDAKGFVHFNTTEGNYILITDAPLTSK